MASANHFTPSRSQSARRRARRTEARPTRRARAERVEHPDRGRRLRQEQERREERGRHGAEPGHARQHLREEEDADGGHRGQSHRAARADEPEGKEDGGAACGEDPLSRVERRQGAGALHVPGGHGVRRAVPEENARVSTTPMPRPSSAPSIMSHDLRGQIGWSGGVARSSTWMVACP